jgi:hypothetical protein
MVRRLVVHIKDIWDAATPIAESTRVQMIARAKEAELLGIRYDRDRSAILMRFSLPDEDIVKEVGAVIGDRKTSNIERHYLGGNLIVQLPAQTYVDRLGGAVPDIQRTGRP